MSARELRIGDDENGNVPGEILGCSPAIQKVRLRIGRIAVTDLDALIIGETGTGKELVANAIHFQSLRRNGPFIAENCGAIASGLLESELFGYERGAFTGAQTSRAGLLQSACNGTLFLDEISYMPLDLQPKLLRVIQERTMRPVGSTREVALNLRIVVASSKDLLQQVHLGLFREELYYRMEINRIELPPLRERLEDIPLLAEHFCRRYSEKHKTELATISAEALSALMEHSWPGNVRELENAIKTVLACCPSPIIRVEDLVREVHAFRDLATSSHTVSFAQCHSQSLRLEHDYLAKLLRAHRGDAASAAKEAQLPLATFYRRLKQHGLNAKQFRPGAPGY